MGQPMVNQSHRDTSILNPSTRIPRLVCNKSDQATVPGSEPQTISQHDPETENPSADPATSRHHHLPSRPKMPK